MKSTYSASAKNARGQELFSSFANRVVSVRSKCALIDASHYFQYMNLRIKLASFSSLSINPDVGIDVILLMIYGKKL